MSTAHGAWTAVVTADGSWTLAHPAHGQTCHSLAGAWEESLLRYARPCRLAERAAALPPGAARSLRVLDIGTGLGLNLAAALAELEPSGVALDVLTLERDAGVLHAMLELARVHGALPGPPELERAHAPVRAALAFALADPGAAAGGVRFEGGRGRLRLALGDARASVQALSASERFDAVFLDPFSPRVEPDLWQLEFLRAVAARMSSGSMLSTYSAALGVRAALVAAGLRVGPSGRVGTKAAGTLASPDLELAPFDARSARRLEARARVLQSGVQTAKSG